MSQKTSKKTKRPANILKCRDDHKPSFFEAVEPGKFKLKRGTQCSWHKDPDMELGLDTLRPRIEPWLTALFQSEHLALLIGSGLTHAVHWMARGGGMSGMKLAKFDVFQSEIDAAANISAQNIGRKTANIEDQIRVANELLIGLEHYCPEASTFRGAGKIRRGIAALRNSVSNVLSLFAKSILDAERAIASAPDSDRVTAFNYLTSFLMSFASRSGTRDRLHLFTTNYDRLIEIGAEVAGLHLLDRFVGSVAPVFRSSRLDIDMHYNPPGIRGEPRYLEGVVRFTKLHGSLDWVDTGHAIRRFGLPFGAADVETYLGSPVLDGATPRSLMIYPNSAKDRETSFHPYVELFRDFAAAICRPNSTLVTYGYGFGDDHINRMIKDMLTISSTHLVIISYGDPYGRIMDIYENLGRPAQITLLVGNHLGDLRSLVDHYLPKPAIDRITFRMTDLLKNRLGVPGDDMHHKDEGKQKE